MGQQCLHYLRLLPPGRRPALPELTIRCFSLGQGTNIAQRLTDLWRDLIHCFYSGLRPSGSRYLLETGDEFLLLQFLQQQPQVYRYKDYDRLLEKLSQPQADYSPLVVDRYALRDKPLAAISQTIKVPGIYLFYQVDVETAHDSRHWARIMLVDEKGSLFTARAHYYNQQTFLRPLLIFIRNALQHQQWSGDLHSALMLDNIQVYELEPARHYLSSGRSGPLLVQARQFPAQWMRIPLMNIKAIADMNADGQLLFSLYCDEQEFSPLAYGDELMPAVARYILGHRRTGEHYPGYITDLDLSLCRETIVQQTGLQLSHYLQIKTDLEMQLNQAMRQLLA
ncbi:putative adenylate cyclase [Cellvibrio japonicus Ueda107]|uniref:Putative adenylate cyclase n=2 Tax=Cellvibrio japonicus TaxID=155077 RepID=B3PH59_CELJU|nr:putative adenylate cyclase [Cellvibrio japonicus Ueda107]